MLCWASRRIFILVKVLKLCTSDEFAPGVPDEARAYRVAERIIAERTGEQVETVLKTIWPTEALPDVIQRWQKEYRPDVVLFLVSPFWMTFESVPLALERRFGRVGGWVGRTTTRVGEHPRLSGSLPVRLARKLSLMLLRGAYYFEPDQVESVVESCLHRLLESESLDVVVRGPLNALGLHGSTRSLRAAEARRRRTDALLARTCARLHVKYVSRSAPGRPDRARFQSDLVHTGVEAHRERGELEGGAIATLWLTHSAQPGATR